MEKWLKRIGLEGEKCHAADGLEVHPGRITDQFQRSETEILRSSYSCDASRITARAAPYVDAESAVEGGDSVGST